MDTDSGEYQEQKLPHREGGEKFYRDLAAQGKKVRVGMEASGHARWFERLLAELNIELWMGDKAKIRAKRLLLTYSDREDARHILNLMRGEKKDDSTSSRFVWPRGRASDDANCWSCWID